MHFWLENRIVYLTRRMHCHCRCRLPLYFLTLSFHPIKKQCQLGIVFFRLDFIDVDQFSFFSLSVFFCDRCFRFKCAGISEKNVFPNRMRCFRFSFSVFHIHISSDHRKKKKMITVFHMLSVLLLQTLKPN